MTEVMSSGGNSLAPGMGDATKKKKVSSKRKTNELSAMAQPQIAPVSFNLSSALTHFLKEKGIENQEKAPVLSQQASEDTMRADAGDSDKQKDVTEALQKIKRLNKQFQRKQNRQASRRKHAEGNTSSSSSEVHSDDSLSAEDERSSFEKKRREESISPPTKHHEHNATTPISRRLPPPQASHSAGRFSISESVNSTDKFPLVVQTVQNTPSTSSPTLASPKMIEYPINHVRHFRSMSVPSRLSMREGSRGILKRRPSFGVDRTRMVSFDHAVNHKERGDNMEIDRSNSMDSLAAVATMALDSSE